MTRGFHHPAPRHRSPPAGPPAGAPERPRVDPLADAIDAEERRLLAKWDRILLGEPEPAPARPRARAPGKPPGTFPAGPPGGPSGGLSGQLPAAPRDPCPAGMRGPPRAEAPARPAAPAPLDRELAAILDRIGIPARPYPYRRGDIDAARRDAAAYGWPGACDVPACRRAGRCRGRLVPLEGAPCPMPSCLRLLARRRWGPGPLGPAEEARVARMLSWVPRPAPAR
jgi:hypothetical protein